MASNSRTLELTADVRGFHVFQKKWKPALNEQLHCLQEPGNDVFSIKICKPDNTTVGHLPRKISSPTKFLLGHGAKIVAEIKRSHYRRSPLINGRLEILCKFSLTLSDTIKNHMFLDRYKELVNKLYCEPKNEVIIGSFFNICTKWDYPLESTTTTTTAGPEESKSKKKNYSQKYSKLFQ